MENLGKSQSEGLVIIFEGELRDLTRERREERRRGGEGGRRARGRGGGGGGGGGGGRRSGANAHRSGFGVAGETFQFPKSHRVLCGDIIKKRIRK